MLATVARWGNSHAIRLSKDVMQQSHLKPNDTIEITVNQDNSILLRKATTTKAEKFMELYGDFKGDWSCTEADTGYDIGKEVFD